jgi:hypothetical protein
MVLGNTAISEPTLPIEREVSLEHAQRCSFLIMEKRCGPLTVEKIPGKPCDFCTNLTKRAKAKSGACAEVQFPYFGTGSCPLAVEMFPVRHLLFRTYLSKTARAQSGACAEVKFPVY